MNFYFLTASFLAFGIALAHSILGERYILIRLFRGELPHLFGSDVFTKRTLRFAWHLTSIAWWGCAGIFLLFSQRSLDPTASAVLWVLEWMFLINAILAFVGSRGKHLSWLVFLLIAVASWVRRCFNNIANKIFSLAGLSSLRC